MDKDLKLFSALCRLITSYENKEFNEINLYGMIVRNCVEVTKDDYEIISKMHTNTMFDIRVTICDRKYTINSMLNLTFYAIGEKNFIHVIDPLEVMILKQIIGMKISLKKTVNPTEYVSFPV